MKRCVAEYISAARRFERLARLEPCSEVKQLMNEQAATCVKLAIKRAKEVDVPRWQMPPPIDWVK